jgi:hypothetical protein
MDRAAYARAFLAHLSRPVSDAARDRVLGAAWRELRASSSVAGPGRQGRLPPAGKDPLAWLRDAAREAGVDELLEQTWLFPEPAEQAARWGA